MGTRSGYLTRRPSLVWLVVLTAWIGVAEATAQVETTPEQQALRTSISERYEVVRLSQGVGLVPKAEGSDVRLIELTDGTVAVNGVLVSGQELGELVGEDAGLIVQLTYLDADARLALFEIDRPAEAAGAAEPAASAPPPPRPAEVGETPRPRRRTDRRGGIVRVLGSVTVDADELVAGDIVVIAGSLRVDGAVDGDIVVVGGSASFGPAAIAQGDVTVVGGGLRRAPTARIEGQMNDIGLGLLSFEGIGLPNFRVRPARSVLPAGECDGQRAPARAARDARLRGALRGAWPGRADRSAIGSRAVKGRHRRVAGAVAVLPAARDRYPGSWRCPSSGFRCSC